MFFILSKVLFFLIVPFSWLVMLLVWIWLTKNQRLKKRLVIAFAVIFIVFTNPFIYRCVVLQLQTPLAVLPAGKTYEAGVVLGGFSGYDKYNRGYFGDNADRFIQTANLYHRGIIKKIIISGGNGSLFPNSPAEAVYLRQQFLDNGVADSAIIMETASRNTYENAVFSKRISDSLHLQEPLVLVTSAEHMKRSMSCFNKAGLKCIAYPCDYKTVPQDPSFDNTVFPKIDLLARWGHTIKEFVGLWVYRATGKA